LSEEEEPSNINWKKELKQHIKNIQETKVKDRLDVCAAMGFMFAVLQESVNNWLKWLSNPTIMKEFSEEELKEFYDIVRKTSIELLEIDYNSTDKYDEVIKKVSKNEVGNQRKQRHVV